MKIQIENYVFLPLEVIDMLLFRFYTDQFQNLSLD
jgi:hypothetical protein